MKTIFQIFIGLAFLLASPIESLAQGLPSAESMRRLAPAIPARLQGYDRLFPIAAQAAEQTHARYSDPAVLADVQRRLNRMQSTGLPEDIFSSNEMEQFKVNMLTLRQLEANYFDRWSLRLPMTAAIKLQSWITKRNSPVPQGAHYDAVLVRLQSAARANHLYAYWNRPLPEVWGLLDGPSQAVAQSSHEQPPKTWGELLLRFNADSSFRELWVARNPMSLPELKKLSENWAWEDSSVRSIKAKNINTPQEYWVLDRTRKNKSPNRFEIILQQDWVELAKLEYAPTVFFNRISRISTTETEVIYHLESVEKGRTMELATTGETGSTKQTFYGSEFLRKSKADEFLQREYVRKGSLNLFLGMRTIQLNQIQDLIEIYPQLVLAVGQFGFSVTGGRAQTVSNRTDSRDEQLLKLTATLTDLIDFAHTSDVNAWFKENTSYVSRAILGGVGAGGSQALKTPASSKLPAEKVFSALMCKELFSH